jgi:predicted Zn-dependent protease
VTVFSVSGVLPGRLLACTLSFPFLLLSVARSQDAPPARATATSLSALDTATLKRALSAYDQGHAREAEPLLRDLVRRYPKNFEAMETLGLVYAEDGNPSLALLLLEESCRLRPSSSLAQGNLGAAYLKLNRPEEALGALKRATALDPENSQTRSALGQALMATDHPADAARAFAVAAAGQPGNADILYNWALALFDAGDAEPAGEVLSRVPEKESSPQVQSLFGDVEERLGHFERAVSHFKTAASLNPSEANVYALGLELARHWTFHAAIKVYEFGVSRYPASARLQLGLGVAKYGDNDYAGAAPIFSRLLAADADNALYADLLGHSCSLIAEQQTEGCDRLQAFAEQHPQNWTAAAFAAAAILKRPSDEQDPDLALRLLQQAMVANPKFADVYFELAVLDQQEMRWQESTAWLEKAIVLRPNFSEAHYRLARAYSHLGRREEAQHEIALEQQYSQEAKDNLNGRLRKVTTFLVTLQ